MYGGYTQYVGKHDHLGEGGFQVGGRPKASKRDRRGAGDAQPGSSEGPRGWQGSTEMTRSFVEEAAQIWRRVLRPLQTQLINNKAEGLQRNAALITD